jgi:hypothetical protein
MPGRGNLTRSKIRFKVINRIYRVVLLKIFWPQLADKQNAAGQQSKTKFNT